MWSNRSQAGPHGCSGRYAHWLARQLQSSSRPGWTARSRGDTVITMCAQSSECICICILLHALCALCALLCPPCPCTASVCLCMSLCMSVCRSETGAGRVETSPNCGRHRPNTLEFPPVTDTECGNWLQRLDHVDGRPRPQYTHRSLCCLSLPASLPSESKASSGSPRTPGNH